MKIGKNDKNVILVFTDEELDFLHENVYQMAEAFDLDDKIDNLDYGESIALYRWDLECLQDVTEIAKDDTPIESHAMIDALLEKLEKAYQQT
jgi:hypothetical protein